MSIFLHGPAPCLFRQADKSCAHLTLVLPRGQEATCPRRGR